MTTEASNKGLTYGPGIVGKILFRVSERYVADHVAPLIESRRPDAAKLDLVLRGIALSPEHAGQRAPGIVLRARTGLDYPALHDLVRDPRRFSVDRPEDDDEDAVVRDRKREWVREQLQVLEDRKLLVREDMGDGRRQIWMKCDLGNGDPFDDPGAEDSRRSYVTILGGVLVTPDFRTWGSPELAGFLCSMVADRYARNGHMRRTGEVLEPGSATWFRQADWFNNRNGYRPDGHVVLPFSTTTIERGLKAMRDRGYISAERKKRAPDGKRLLHPRLIYTNRYHEFGHTADVIDITDRVRTA